MINSKTARCLLYFSLLCLLFVPRVSAQTTSIKRETDALHEFNTAVRSLVRRVTPSVVQVIVTGYGPVETNGLASTSLVLGRQESMGSGVIIDADGYIVTNAHVVMGAHRVQVNVPVPDNVNSPEESIAGGRTHTLEARIIGLDTEIDLALLKIEAKGLRALPIGDYNKVRQGDVVLAFGSPEGLQDSVTMGVVGAVSRQPDPDRPLVFIQSDAPINPGSSGGPLVNVDGEVVGINTYILTASGGNEGLGFAIPSNIVAFAYPQLRRFGHVHRGETGIAVQAITPALAAGLKLPVDSGVIISDVLPGSSAETAGLKVRDIITSIDGRPVDNMPALGTRLFMRRGGERINLGVLRGSEKLNLEVPVMEPSHESDRLAAIADPVKGLVSKLGILAVDVDAKVAPSLAGLRYASGVLVVAKDAGAGIDVSLATGDVIHAINGLPIETVDGLRSSLDHAGSGNHVVLQIEREGKLMFITVKTDNND